MKELFLKSAAYLTCAFLTCWMLKAILGIGTGTEIHIKHTVSTGAYGSLDIHHSGHCRN